MSEDDNLGYIYSRPIKRFKLYHWIAHSVSLGIIIVLLALLKQVDEVSWTSCWALHNYYCTHKKPRSNVNPLTEPRSPH